MMDKELKYVFDLVKVSLNMLHWKKLFKVVWEMDCGLITIGGNITLYKDEIEVEEVSITGDRKKKVEGWCVDVAYETPPSRWEPGDVDVRTEFTSQSPISCIDYICNLCFNQLKDNNFQYLEYKWDNFTIHGTGGKHV